MTREEQERLVDRYLGVFLDHARSASPNIAISVNARAAALAMLEAAVAAERAARDAKWRTWLDGCDTFYQIMNRPPPDREPGPA